MEIFLTLLGVFVGFYCIGRGLDGIYNDFKDILDKWLKH